MGRRKKTGKRSRAKKVLRLPDLEQSKNAVLPRDGSAMEFLTASFFPFSFHFAASFPQSVPCERVSIQLPSAAILPMPESCALHEE